MTTWPTPCWKGAKDALRAQGAEFDVVTVPGALEIPTAIALADEAGQLPDRAAL